MTSIRERFSYRVAATVGAFALLTVGAGALITVRATAADLPISTPMVAFGYLTVLNFGLLGIAVGGDISTELRRLSETALAIGDGDMSVTPQSNRGDEVGTLATALQDMQQSLQTAFDDSKHARREAEEAREDTERFNETLLSAADEVETAMSAVASGDFTRQLDPNTDAPAITQIGTAYDDMANRLSITISEIRSFVRDVEETAVTTAETADTLANDQRVLAEDIRDVADEITDQAEQLQTTAGDVASLAASFEEVAASTERVSERTREGSDLAETGTTTANDAATAMESIQANIKQLDGLVKSLDNQMGDVAKTTALVDDIAEQTDILALNANIETARVETDASGFAVVADEIRGLSEETRDAITEIESLIEATRGEMDEVTEEMGEARSRVEDGTDTVETANTTFQELADVVENIDHETNEIAGATNDGAQTAETVSQAVESATDSVQTVSSRAQSLADTADETANKISELEQQANELVGQTEQLSQRLAQFDTRDVDANAPEQITPEVATDG